MDEIPFTVENDISFIAPKKTIQYTNTTIYKIFYSDGNPANDKIMYVGGCISNKSLSSIFSEITYKYRKGIKSPKFEFLFHAFDVYDKRNFNILKLDTVNLKNKDDLNQRLYAYKHLLYIVPDVSNFYNPDLIMDEVNL